MNKQILHFFRALVFTIAFPGRCADLLDHWVQREPLPTGNNLRAIAHGNNTYAIVGPAGTILTSPDGSRWTVRNTGTNHQLSGITFAEDLFVAVGNSFAADGSPEAAIFTSTDGLVWTPRPPGISKILARVAYGGGNFVAVGPGQACVVSADGITWRPGGPTGIVAGFGFGIAYHSELFATVGINGTIRTSPDGAVWTPRSSGTTQHLFDIAFGNGTFVATGFQGTILTSPNGITWTPQSSGTTHRLFSVTFGNERFMTIGFDVAENAGTKVLTSPDGVTWTEQSTPPTPTINPYLGLGFGNGQFVAVGQLGLIATSSSGQDWALQSARPKAFPIDITYAGNLFVAVGEALDSRCILTSSDGIQWDLRDATIEGGPSNPLFSVCHGNGQFVATGVIGTITTSPDGTNWTAQSSGASTTQLLDVAYGNGQFVICGTDYLSNPIQGVILTSTNASNWTRRLTQSELTFEGIAFGESTFVVVGDRGTIRTSTNGVNWTVRPAGSTEQLFDVTYGNGQFVAVGFNATVLTSPDAITWTRRGAPEAAALYCITFANDLFIVSGEGLGGSPLLSSTDGIQWTRHYVGVDHAVQGMAFGNGHFVQVGSSGILTCDVRPRIGPPVLQQKNAMQFPVLGISGLTYSIESSSDLRNWTFVTDVYASDGTGNVTSATIPNSNKTFFRAMQSPF